ncbi:MAG: hypothetical protein ACYCPS_05905 [Candidatus Saccharimonadales bacterium]
MTRFLKYIYAPFVHLSVGIFCFVAGVLIIFLITSPVFTPTIKPPVYASPSNTFNYGFDFQSNAPDDPSATNGNIQDAVNAARNVMSEFSGSTMDQFIYGQGALNSPEPTPGNYDFSSISPRINMIQSANGIPVITLDAAPDWMKGCNNYPSGKTCPGDTSPSCQDDTSSVSWYQTPPCAAHFQDFANLAAKIAQAFPQVKYFVVWDEMQGFNSGGNLDAANYTNMYNDVYSAIKSIRPDAMVGGPYLPWHTEVCGSGCPSGTLSGPWGYVPTTDQTAMQYWLSHKVGADFVAMDGHTIIASNCSATITTGYSCGAGNNVNIDPLTASQKYAVITQWVKSQTSLPIWWMESHIQPYPGSPEAWSDAQAAAARIATLALMNSSGASVGMQWDPQQTANWDMGLWDSTTEPAANGGGQPTILATELLSVLPTLRQSLTLVGGQPTGVLVATDSIPTAIVVNTLNTVSSAIVFGQNLALAPGEVLLVNQQSVAYSSNPSTSPVGTPINNHSQSSTTKTAAGSTPSSSGTTSNTQTTSNPAGRSITNKVQSGVAGKEANNKKQPTLLLSNKRYFYIGYAVGIIGLFNIAAVFLRWVLYLG